MAEQPPGSDPEAGVPARSGGSFPGTPTWVKVFGIITLAAVVLVIVLLVLGGGHGPSRHSPSGGPTGHTPPIEHRVPGS